MENNPKKSKAFIITFILILILLVVGYYLYKNRTQIFDSKGSTSMSKIFSPLLGTPKDTPLKVIEDPNTTPTTTPVVRKTGIVITEANGNKLVVSEAGEMLKKGDVLYIAGFNKNDQPIVMKAIANDKNKSLVFGVAGEDMNKGALGNVIIEGILTGVPTNRKEGTLWAVNNVLFLSDKVYGGMVKTSPKAPSYIIPVGSVIKVDPINGSIKIGNVANNTNISDLLSNNLDKLNMILLSNSTMELINATINDIRDYFGSIFGEGIFGGIDYAGGGTIDPNAPPVNPITPPGAGPNPGPGIDTTPNTTAMCTNGANNPVLCTTRNGICLNRSTNPPLCTDSMYTVDPINTNTACMDKIDNDKDDKIDEYDPNCHTGGDITKEYNALHDSEVNSPVDANTTNIVNKCLLIEQNPLTFTPEEKARLAVLLRKFYLVSSTLKTTEDVTTTYSEVEQQSNFISQTKELTKQCYAQVDPMMNAGYDWVRHGNPWCNNKNTDNPKCATNGGGSFPYTNENTGYSNSNSSTEINMPAVERVLNIW